MKNETSLLQYYLFPMSYLAESRHRVIRYQDFTGQYIVLGSILSQAIYYLNILSGVNSKTFGRSFPLMSPQKRKGSDRIERFLSCLLLYFTRFSFYFVQTQCLGTTSKLSHVSVLKNHEIRSPDQQPLGQKFGGEAKISTSDRLGISAVRRRGAASLRKQNHFKIDKTLLVLFIILLKQGFFLF